MNLFLETTTGFLVPGGVAAQLGKGGVQNVFLQFVTNGVAGLLDSGDPMLLEVFEPSDLNTPIASISAWTEIAADKVYLGTIDTNAGAMAWLQVPTLVGKITYGLGDTESDLFHIKYGIGSSSGLPSQVYIVNGNDLMVIPMIFMGELTVDQSYGYFVADADGEIRSITHEAQDAPSGSDVTIDVTKNSVEQANPSVLADGQYVQKTTFGVAIPVSAGEVIRLKVKQVGSTDAGSWLKSNIYFRPTTV